MKKLLKKINKLSLNIPYLIVIIILLIYKINWVPYSIWGEDEATNLWLGYIYDIKDLKVGLLSSQFIPNPNGMLIIGKILSLFNSLDLVSYFLVIVNCLIIYLLSKNLFPNSKIDSLILFSAVASSLLLSSNIIEFWNQWLLITFNLTFVLFLIKFLNNKKLITIFYLIFITFIPISIYLGGFTSSLLIGLITIHIYFKTFKVEKFFFIKTLAFAFFTFLFFWFITFANFFQSVELSRLSSLNKLTTSDKFKYFLNNLLELPGGLLNLWNKKSKFVIYQYDDAMINEFTKTAFNLYFQTHKLISLFVILLVLIGLFLNLKNLTKLKNKQFINVYFYLLFFISASLVLSPIYGGPDYLIHGEKANNLNQYYALFLILWYLTPFLFSNNLIFKKYLIKFSRALFIFFISINLVAGTALLNDNKNFNENFETRVEPPLKDRMEVVSFIANDWLKTTTKNEISIHYETKPTYLTWFDKHSLAFGEYYADNPYTIGRAYDYQLLRKFGLLNTKSKKIDYIISNAYFSEPEIPERKLEHFYFGRLRVSK